MSVSHPTASSWAASVSRRAGVPHASRSSAPTEGPRRSAWLPRSHQHAVERRGRRARGPAPWCRSGWRCTEFDGAADRVDRRSSCDSASAATMWCCRRRTRSPGPRARRPPGRPRRSFRRAGVPTYSAASPPTEWPTSATRCGSGCAGRPQLGAARPRSWRRARRADRRRGRTDPRSLDRNRVLLPRFCTRAAERSALGSVVTNTRNPSAASSEAKSAQSPFASVNPCWSQISPRGSPAGRYQSVGTRCVRKAHAHGVWRSVTARPAGPR